MSWQNEIPAHFLAELEGDFVPMAGNPRHFKKATKTTDQRMLILNRVIEIQRKRATVFAFRSYEPFPISDMEFLGIANWIEENI